MKIKKKIRTKKLKGKVVVKVGLTPEAKKALAKVIMSLLTTIVAGPKRQTKSKKSQKSD